ncbi:MAG: hypothetical protein WBF53_01985 [Litorimonas sp.]
MNELMNNACWLMTAEALWETESADPASLPMEPPTREESEPLFI